MMTNETGSFRLSWESWRISRHLPRDSRASMQRSLLRILAVAHQERLQPATLVANLAREHVGSNRRVLNRLARRLREGVPLVAAVEQTPDALGESQVLALRFGTQSGTLGPVYQELLARAGGATDSAERSLRQTLVYLTALLMVLTIAFSFWSLFLLPVFEKILEYFTSRRPGQPFELLAGLRDWFGDGMALVPFVVAGVLLLIWALPVRRWLRWVFNSRIGWINQVRSAELLRLLAVASESGRPLAGALSTLARYHFDPGVRARLLLARNEVEQGAGVWQSLHDARVLSSTQAEALSTATSDGSRIWLLRSFSDQQRELAQASAQAAARRLQTGVILAIAGLLSLLSIACFQFLNHLVTQSL